MLGLDASHRGHVIGADHGGVVGVEEQKNGAGDRDYRKNPCGPERSELLAGAGEFDTAECEKKDRERLMLNDFGV